MLALFRTTLCALLALWVLPASAQQIDNPDALKARILGGLMQPLPLTIIGPLMAPNSEIEIDGNTATIQLSNTSLMGMLPLGDIRFTLTALGDDRYAVSDFQTAEQVALPGGAELMLGQAKLDGIWSFATNSYEQLEFGFDGLSIMLNDFEMARLDGLRLYIAQQGKGDIDASRLALELGGLTANVPDLGPVAAQRALVSLDMRTGRPLDLHAALSRLLVASFMAQDQAALLQVLDFFRLREYETLDLSIDLDDVMLSLEDEFEEPLSLKHARLQLSGQDISQDQFGQLVLGLSAQQLSLMPDDVRLTLGQGEAVATVDSLPIAQILAASTAIQLAAAGQDTGMTLGQVYDAFFGFDALTLDFSLQDAEAFNPTDNDLRAIRVADVQINQRLLGFKDLVGKLVTNAYVNGFTLELPPVPTSRKRWNSDDQRFETVPADQDWIDRKAQELAFVQEGIALFAPQQAKLSASLTGFSDDVIKAILDGLPLDADTPTHLLALIGILPTLELASEGALDYQTQYGRLTAQDVTTTIPMRLLSLSPYDTRMSLRFDGWDAYSQALIAWLAEADPDLAEARKVILPIKAVMQAYGQRDGDAIHWQIETQSGSDVMQINDRNLYLPNGLLYILTSALPGLVMGGVHF